MARKSDGKKQNFFFTAPSAARVQLVGDFTGWMEAPVEMKKGRQGIWQTSVTLPPGTHQYRFIVDGQWCDDPNCPTRVPNPYGSEDSVLQVG